MEAETRNAQTLLRAGNHEEALQAASQLFELCTEADFQASTMIARPLGPLEDEQQKKDRDYASQDDR